MNQPPANLGDREALVDLEKTRDRAEPTPDQLAIRIAALQAAATILSCGHANSSGGNLQHYPSSEVTAMAERLEVWLRQ